VIKYLQSLIYKYVTRKFINTRSNGVLYVGDDELFYAYYFLFFLFLIMFLKIDIDTNNTYQLFPRFGAIIIVFSIITMLKKFRTKNYENTIEIRDAQALKHKYKILEKVKIFRYLHLLSHSHASILIRETCEHYYGTRKMIRKVTKLEKEKYDLKFEKMETIAIISGTIIWAYGDFLTKGIIGLIELTSS